MKATFIHVYGLLHNFIPPSTYVNISLNIIFTSACLSACIYHSTHLSIFFCISPYLPMYFSNYISHIAFLSFSLSPYIPLNILIYLCIHIPLHISRCPLYMNLKFYLRQYSSIWISLALSERITVSLSISPYIPEYSILNICTFG